MQKIKKIFQNKKLQNLLFIFFISLTPLLWFRGNEIIVGHDNVFALNPITFLQGRLFTWVDHGFGQSQDLIMGTIPIHFIDAIPYMLGLSVQATEKIVYVFWFFMMGLSAYILASVINPKNRIFQLVAVLLYQFNFFILQAWWIGERTKFSAYIALPLLLALFLRVFRGDLAVTKGVIYSSLVFLVFNAGGLYGIPLYGGLFIAIGVFILLSTIFSVRERNWLAIKRITLLSVFSCLGFFLVNSYYLFPLFERLTSEYATSVSGVGGVGGLIEWANTISANTSYINLMRLQGIPEWYDNVNHPYAKYFLENPLFIALSFVWPILILVTLFRRQEKEPRKMILIFLLIYLVGILFAAGTHKPLGGLYAALMTHVPGFAVFRSPYYKFAPAIFLGASFLVAYAIGWLHGKKKIVVFFIFLFFILFYHFPYFTGEIFSWKKGFSTRLTIPEYVFSFGEWLNKEKNDQSRVLMLPPNDPNFRYSSYDWGYLSFQSLPTLLSNEPVVINNDRVNDSELRMMEALYQALLTKDEQSVYQLASNLGIRYILLQEDSVLEGAINKSYKEALGKIRQLSVIKRFGAWSVYQFNSSVLPATSLFYTSDEMSVISGQIRHFGIYADLNSNLQAIVKKEDLQSAELNIANASAIYSPNCLKCMKKDRPLINYPERNILPDSPFYPIILLSEERKLHYDNPKSLVYDYIGLMLKRFSEIKEMVEKDIEIKEDTLNRLETIVKLAQKNFDLVKNEDKYDVSEDLKYYVDDLRNVMTIMLGDRVRSGLPVVVFTRILSSIGKLELDINPYLFNKDITQNRLYELTIDKSGKFDIYIRSKEFDGLSRDKSSIKAQIDNGKNIELAIDENMSRPRWFSLGTVDIQKGKHELSLSFGELFDLVGQFSPSVTEFNSDRRTECYTTRLKDFDPGKQYKMIINYKKSILSDVNLYTWEERGQETRIRSADRLNTALAEQEFTQDIKPNASVKGIVLGICAIGLTKEYIQERFSIKVHEYLEPVIAFVSEDLKPSATKEVSYQKIDPTKYIVSFTTSVPNASLIFSSRFDKGWNLESFENKHIHINGFANGWVIDKPGTYSLTLEYQPQKAFQLGGFVSLSSVLIGIVYLLAGKRRRKVR